MIEKIKSAIQNFLNKLPKTAPGTAMRYILWYALFLALCAALYVIMILADWAISGRPNLAEMRQFLGVMLSGAAVAAIGFCGRWLVDQDGNGIPDEAEKDNRPYPPYPTVPDNKKGCDKK